MSMPPDQLRARFSASPSLFCRLLVGPLVLEQMQPLRKKLLWSAVILAVACCLWVLVVGPHGLTRGSYRILASLPAADGSKLYLVSRAGGFTDPYDIYLYRVEKGTNISVCGVDSESSYWWAPRLTSTTSDRIEIGTLNSTVAWYSVSERAVHLLQGVGMYRLRQIDQSSQSDTMYGELVLRGP